MSSFNDHIRTALENQETVEGLDSVINWLCSNVVKIATVYSVPPQDVYDAIDLLVKITEEDEDVQG